MSLPRLTQKEMTESEQRELKTLLDRARIAHGRPLTNSEANHVKKEYIDKLMAQREQAAKQTRKQKKRRRINRTATRPFHGPPARPCGDGVNAQPRALSCVRLAHKSGAFFRAPVVPRRRRY